MDTVFAGFREILASFGGLLMMLIGDLSVAAKFELDQRLFVLIRKVWYPGAIGKSGPKSMSHLIITCSPSLPIECFLNVFPWMFSEFSYEDANIPAFYTSRTSESTQYYYIFGCAYVPRACFLLLRNCTPRIYWPSLKDLSSCLARCCGSVFNLERASRAIYIYGFELNFK